MNTFATQSNGDRARQEVRSNVIKLLDHSGIDWRSAWGRGGTKSLEHLVEEVACNESTLMFDKGRLVRGCSVVRVEILYKANEHQTLRLREAQQIIEGSGTRERTSDFAVWEKVQGKESPHAAAVRGISEELQIPNTQPIYLEEGVYLEEPQDYPGLPTLLKHATFQYVLRPGEFRPRFDEVHLDRRSSFEWNSLP